MQLACPACAATYQVPDALIGDGRQMHCVRCGEEWFARPPAPLPIIAVPAPVVEVETSPTVPVVAKPPPLVAATAPAKRSGSLALLLAWLGSVGLWAGGLYGLWAMRQELSTFWPPIARLYALLGPS